MSSDELRKKERARLVARHEEAKNSYRETIAGWATHYPQIQAKLWQHYKEYCQDLDADLTRFDEGRRADLDKVAEVNKRQAWELFTLLESVDSELQIVTLYDKVCAAIDQALAVSKSQRRAIDAATQQAKVAKDDAMIDYHLAKSKDEKAE